MKLANDMIEKAQGKVIFSQGNALINTFSYI